jgi:inorganic triphosphatase YgiF
VASWFAAFIDGRLEGPDARYVPTGEATLRELIDRYLDTADGRLGQAGLAARIRSELGRHTLTVKSAPNPVAGPVHRRLEVEGPAEPTLVPGTWPASAARSLVLAAVGDAPLIVVACLRQRRLTRTMRQDEVAIEMSLDDLEAVDGPRGAQVLGRRTELEAELVAGEPDDLAGLASWLEGRPGLAPATESKLDWARRVDR